MKMEYGVPTTIAARCVALALTIKTQNVIARFEFRRFKARNNARTHSGSHKNIKIPTMYMMKQILGVVLLIGSQVVLAAAAVAVVVLGAKPTAAFAPQRMLPHRPRFTSPLFSSTGRATDGQEWIDASIEYYTKIMRGQEQHGAKDRRTATKLYFALQNIRQGRYHRAEAVYRRALDEIERLNDDGQCENAKLASTTLLLALVLQRMGDIKEARNVFHKFFRFAMKETKQGPITECACSAKVLGAYALFEMKHGTGSKKRSLHLARQATTFDQSLSKLLDWKLFKEVD
jgi:tetratricopeptide (TPR) repeat protein